MSEVGADTTVPVTTLSAALGVSERRVQQLANDGVIKKAGSGKYLLLESVRGYVDFLQARTAFDENGGGLDLVAEQARLTKAKADIAEIELAKAMNDVGSIAEIERAWVAAFSVIRVNVMNVVQRVTPMLIGETCERTFKEKLRGELTEALEKSADSDIELDQFADE